MSRGLHETEIRKVAAAENEKGRGVGTLRSRCKVYDFREDVNTRSFLSMSGRVAASSIPQADFEISA